MQMPRETLVFTNNVLLKGRLTTSAIRDSHYLQTSKLESFSCLLFSGKVHQLSSLTASTQHQTLTTHSLTHTHHEHNSYRGLRCKESFPINLRLYPMHERLQTTAFSVCDLIMARKLVVP
jgi:hypothetical protein